MKTFIYLVIKMVLYRLYRGNKSRKSYAITRYIFWFLARCRNHHGDRDSYLYWWSDALQPVLATVLELRSANILGNIRLLYRAQVICGARMLCQVLEEASAESVYTDAVMVNSLDAVGDTWRRKSHGIYHTNIRGRYEHLLFHHFDYPVLCPCPPYPARKS